ncbi:MAG: hypothetical protein KME26_17100 [Oscillatoria princeps RMCB-10]|nr:hypothetical protein [Oscillatoria princeps RMCB-10]
MTSKKGLTKIKQAREKKGWQVAGLCWLEAASRVLPPDFSRRGAKARFHSGGLPHSAGVW